MCDITKIFEFGLERIFNGKYYLRLNDTIVIETLDGNGSMSKYNVSIKRINYDGKIFFDVPATQFGRKYFYFYEVNFVDDGKYKYIRAF